MSDAPLQLPPGVLLPEVEKRLIETAAKTASAQILAEVGPVLQQIRSEFQEMKDGLRKTQRPVNRPSWKIRTGSFLYDYRAFIVGSIVLVACLLIIYLNWNTSKEVLKDLTWLIFSSNEVSSFLLLWLSGLASWLILRILNWIGIKIKADQVTALQSSIDKAMTLATVEAHDKIQVLGWNHPNVKSEVITRALSLVVEKFSDTLIANGLNVANEADRARVQDQMKRMLPDVFTRLAASPATPPADVIPVAAVTASAGS